MTVFIILIIISLNFISIYANSAYEMLRNSVSKINNIPNYTCDIELKVDVDFIKMSNRKGKMTFIKPDSVSYQIEGFALLPKIDFMSQLKKLNPEEFTILENGEEKVNNVQTKIIKLVPNKMDGEIILAQLWIDAKNYMRKVVIYSKEQGKFEFQIDYANEKYPVANKITLFFDIKEMKLPPGMTGDMNKFKKVEPKKGTTAGSIVINYNNYKFGK